MTQTETATFISSVPLRTGTGGIHRPGALKEQKESWYGTTVVLITDSLHLNTSEDVWPIGFRWVAGREATRTAQLARRLKIKEREKVVFFYLALELLFRARVCFPWSSAPARWRPATALSESEKVTGGACSHHTLIGKNEAVWRLAANARCESPSRAISVVEVNFRKDMGPRR